MTVRLAIASPFAAVVEATPAGRGAPRERRFDEFGPQWQVARRVPGGDRDGAGAAVQRQGSPHGIAAFRRPGRARRTLLAGDVRRAVGAARDSGLPG
ncbi:MAG TPA: hypothetical protein VIN61_07580 [Gammaproteobacteria bacterium]